MESDERKKLLAEQSDSDLVDWNGNDRHKVLAGVLLLVASIALQTSWGSLPQ